MALWVLGGLLVALSVVLLTLDARMQDTDGPGIVGFELAAGEERVDEILGEWGEKGRDAARLSLWLDYPYLIVYGAFMALAIAAIRDFASRQGWRKLAAAGQAMVPFPIAAAGLDALENIGLLLALEEKGGTAAPLLATVFATGKFILLALALGYIVTGLLRRAHLRVTREPDA